MFSGSISLVDFVGEHVLVERGDLLVEKAQLVASIGFVNMRNAVPKCIRFCLAQPDLT